MFTFKYNIIPTKHEEQKIKKRLTIKRESTSCLEKGQSKNHGRKKKNVKKVEGNRKYYFQKFSKSNKEVTKIFQKTQYCKSGCFCYG